MTHVIAHRGLRSELPENTLAAIEAAIRLPGIAGVEFDGELSADKKIVVLHQETLVASSDFTRIELASRNVTSRDWVQEATAERLGELDAGSWMGAEFASCRVPRLEEVFALSWGSVPAYLELKDATYWGKRDVARPSQIIEAALPAIQGFSGLLHVISFHPEILRLLRERTANIQTILAVWTEWVGKEREAISTATECGATTISLPDRMVLESPQWVEYAHASNLLVHVYPISPARDEPEFSNWTAESQKEKWAKLRELGVDALVSDFARETIQAMSVAKSHY